MKLIGMVLVSLLAMGSIQPVEARDTRHMLSFEGAMSTSAAKEKLNQGIQFYFGKQKHAEPKKNFGEFTSNKKTNAFGKSDQEACEWAFLSAMVQFQKRALEMGGDAVVNIKSYYKGNEIESNTEFECGAGAIMAGVTFKGTVVKLK